eukprot:TRINITY_DN422_c1_g1_i2.p1 TRINITY_DN422_c1_g1~~TRINITY_DN422_c1_g1_i2.p1  ORF type:complete len:278 (-),score=62.03 TRINITY_DN422_c1_g1_i2:26-859(-)
MALGYVPPLSQEYLISVLSFLLELYAPYKDTYNDELLKFSIKLSDLLFSLEDYERSLAVLQETLKEYKVVTLERIRVLLKIAESAIELYDVETAVGTLRELERLAGGSSMNNRMSKRPSKGSSTERTFLQVYNICTAKTECLKGEFGYASHLFWQVSMEGGADQHECRKNAVLCAIMAKDKDESEGMLITMQNHKDLEGLQTLRKIVNRESLCKEDVLGFEEGILPFVHAVGPSGLSAFQERIIQYQLGIGKEGELFNIFVGDEREMVKKSIEQFKN